MSELDFKPSTHWGRPKQGKKLVGCGMTKFYELMNSGRIRSKKVDGLRLVDLESCERLGEPPTPDQAT